MSSKQRILYVAFYLPGVIALIRIGVTLWFLVNNPLGLPLRFIQLVPLGAIIATSFSYYKLYRDSVPVISLLAPSIIHAILIFVFKKVIIWQPFVVLLAIDILYMIARGVKSSMFPFDIEDDEEDDLASVEDLFAEAE